MHLEYYIQYIDGGTYLDRHVLHYDYGEAGSVDIVLERPGEWFLEDNVLVDITGQPQLVELTADTDVPRDLIETEILKRFRADDESRLQFKFVGPDRLAVIDLDNGEDYGCVRTGIEGLSS
jgi:hypothetical protein